MIQNGRPTTPDHDDPVPGPAPTPAPKTEADDLLNEELEDSFPASDPPSSTQPVHPSERDDDRP